MSAHRPGTNDEIATRRYNDPLWRITACDGGPFPEAELPFRRVVASGAPVYDVRHAIEWPDGKQVLLSINAAPLCDQTGALTGVVTTFEEITELLRTQEALSASERRYRSLFNAMHDAFSLHEIVCDEEGRPCDYRFLDVNPAFEKLTGIPAQDWIGHRVLEVLPETEPYWIELCGEVALSGRAQRFERYAQAFDRYYEVLAYSPEPGQFAALSTDITERKRAEESLLRRSRLDATATLAGGIAHDFNNLMVGVIGNAEIALMDCPSGSSLSQRIGEIVKAGQRAGALAQQMLAFARPESAAPCLLRVEDAIDEVVRLHARTLPPRVKHSVNIAADLWSLRADRSQIVQVLMNLFINATEAIDGAGSIDLEVCNVDLSESAAGDSAAPATATHRRASLAPGRYLRIALRDTGRGMDAKTRSRLFEPFFTTKATGRGLGLAAVHGIVQAHGGSVEVTSSPGNGTAFEVYLPATEERPRADVPTAAVRGGSETILLIDDEALVLEPTRRNLERLGYRVLVADGGRRALDVAAQHVGEIALAVLDLAMPDMPGGDVYPLLAELHPETKVVLCSGYDIGKEAQTLLDAGARAFVRKPFLIDELAAQIRDLLDE